MVRFTYCAARCAAAGSWKGRRIPARAPYTPRAKRALRLAAEEAKAMQDSHGRPEPLFVGLLLEGEGVAALALKNLGVNSQTARDEILKARSNQSDS